MDNSTQIAPARRTRRRPIGDGAIQRMFIVPTMVLLVVWNIFPLFYSLYLSFTQYSHSGKASPLWIGVKNFSTLLTDPKIWGSFAVTGRYALLSVLLQMLVGFAMALLLHAKFKGNGLLTTLILIPMMLSPAVVGLFWKLIFNPLTGIFNYLIGFWSPATSPIWLKDYALWSVVIVDVWMWSPFVMLLCLSGLKAIPDYIYEAAAIDRASGWRQFWRITLPQVSPLLMLAVLFRTIEALPHGRRAGQRHRDSVRRPLPHGLPGPGPDWHCQCARLYDADRYPWREQRLHPVSQQDAGGLVWRRTQKAPIGLRPDPARRWWTRCAWIRLRRAPGLA